MVLFLAVSTVLLAVVFLLAWLREDKSKLQDSMIALLITMAGTFFGVYLAVYVTDLHQYNSERQQLSALFVQAKREVTIHLLQGEQNLKLSLDEKKGGVGHLDANPVPELVTLDYLISNPLVSKHEQVISLDLLVDRQNLKSLIQRINSTELSSGSRIESFRNYLFFLSHLEGILILGKKYADGEIGDAEFSAARSELGHELDKRAAPVKSSKSSVIIMPRALRTCKDAGEKYKQRQNKALHPTAYSPAFRSCLASLRASGGG